MYWPQIQVVCDFANRKKTKEFINKNGGQEIEFETFAKPWEVHVRISLVLKQTKK